MSDSACSSEVDYATVRLDYEYFLAHSNETAAQIHDLSRQMKWLANQRAPSTMLDLGCGTGAFSCKLLNSTAAIRERRSQLLVTLVEPVAEHLLEAENRFSKSGMQAVPLRELCSVATQFDFILANHSLYYVPDLSATIGILISLLKPHGRCVIAMIDRRNDVAKIWKSAFSLIGEPFPFALAEDAEGVLSQTGAAIERTRIGYSIRFPNSEVGKARVLRFLLGSAYERLPRPDGLRVFDPYRLGDDIVITTSYRHLIINK